MTFNWSNTSIEQLNVLFALAVLFLSVPLHSDDAVTLPGDIELPSGAVALPMYLVLGLYAICHGYPIYYLLGIFTFMGFFAYVPKWAINGIARIPFPSNYPAALPGTIRGAAYGLSAIVGYGLAIAFLVQYHPPFPKPTLDPRDADAAMAALYRRGGYWVPVAEARSELMPCAALLGSASKRLTFYHFAPGHLLYRTRAQQGGFETGDIPTRFEVIGNQILMHQVLSGAKDPVHFSVRALYDPAADRIADLDGYQCDSCKTGPKEGPAMTERALNIALGSLDLDTRGRLYRFCSGDLPP